MSNIQQQLEGIFIRELKKIPSKTRLNRAGAAMARIALKLNRDRTLKGWDSHGKRFPPLSRSYKKQKRRYINGAKIKRGRNKGKKVGYNFDRPTKYKAVKLPNMIRLTGRSLSFLKVSKPTTKAFESQGSVKMTISFKIYQSDRKRNKIANYLKEMNREYIGLVKEKGSKFYRDEQKAIKEAFLKSMFPDATLYSGKIKLK